MHGDRPLHDNGPRFVQKKAYIRLTKHSNAQWLSKVCAESPAPEGAQLEYLKGVMDRCAREAAEIHGRVPKAERNSEPSREFLLGPPGAGKSECLKWTIRYFEECLGWEHGVQYQCLASQHTMAALIGGTAMHGWGQVPSKHYAIIQSRSSKER